MASEEFVRFLEALVEDEGLRQRFAAIEADSVQQSVSEMVALGASAGFAFDRQDVSTVLARARQPRGPLLDTTELQIVSGGRSGEGAAPTPLPPPDGGRTVLYDTDSYRRILVELREKVESDGAQAAVLDQLLAGPFR